MRLCDRHRSEWTQHINTYRIEAATRLGDWSSLEQAMKQVWQQLVADSQQVYCWNVDKCQYPGGESTSRWDVGLGKMLLAAKRKVCYCQKAFVA